MRKTLQLGDAILSYDTIYVIFCGPDEHDILDVLAITPERIVKTWVHESWFTAERVIQMSCEVNS